ncbi:uncharacterized protein LOC133479793 [Phyllopteryx taeniolatus]|uniref:uncharacterized protein LOC133479793 n=1 Tax=Phyllopteryx taeniolatus TaxID=161469 RepID=UPI002AD518DE|nr:uncharacterized protein LOC133479793 [Phyllopteryx taeniolatus]
MPTKKMVIANLLENLSKKNYDKFCMALVDRRGERKVALGKVEDKNFLEVTNVVVSTFTEDGAPAVTSELLTLIGCLEEAKELDTLIAQLPSKPSSGKTAAASAGRQAGGADDTPHSKEVHFVDKHRLELIVRVGNINRILDVLLDKKVIQDEVYDEIREMPGNENKMRNIYRLALKSGVAAKDVFLDTLIEYEPYLVADLKH